MFRLFGHPNHLISIVNGGLPAWERSGYEITDIVPTAEVQNYEVSYKSHLVKSMDEVRTILKENKVTVVDARPSGLFDGTAPYPIPGNSFEFFYNSSFSAKSWQNPARIDMQWVAIIECQCWQDSAKK